MSTIELISDILATINFWIGTTAIGLFDDIGDITKYIKSKMEPKESKKKSFKRQTNALLIRNRKGTFRSNREFLRAMDILHRQMLHIEHAILR